MRVELDADRSLLLDPPGHANRAACRSGGRVEVDLGLVTLAHEGAAGSARATVLLQQSDRLGRRVVELLEVLVLLRSRQLADRVERVVQRLDGARVEDAAVDRVDHGLPVQAHRKRLVEPVLLQQVGTVVRVSPAGATAGRPELEVDVLLGEARLDAVLDAVLGEEVVHGRDRLTRSDRVDLAGLHGVDLGRLSGVELPDDRLEMRLGTEPLRVGLEDQACARRPAREVERAIRDRILVGIAADAVGPERVERLAGERLLRVDVAEEVLVVGERLLPVEGDLLLAVHLGPRDLVVADGGSDVVTRRDDLLPGVDVVGSRHRERLVADPVPVRVLANGDLEVVLGGHDLRCEVEDVLALLADHVVAANDRRLAEVRGPGAGEVDVGEVESAGILLHGEVDSAVRLSRSGRAVGRKRVRERGLRGRGRLRARGRPHGGSGARQCEHGYYSRCREEPDPFVHYVPSVRCAPGALDGGASSLRHSMSVRHCAKTTVAQLS